MIPKGLSASPAAYSCGFDNLSCFYRTFRKIIGAPPSVFSKG